MAAYATPADLAQRYDVRTLLELPSDTNEAIDSGDLDDNAILLMVLEDASGQVEAALLAGQRYSAADLEDLTGNPLGLLKRLVCQIAFTFLEERRGGLDPDQFEKRMQWPNDMLDRLRRGENIFGITEVLEASVPSREVATPASVEAAGLMRSRVNHYYPNQHFPR